MEEDIKKQGTLFLQQQRFGKKWKRVWCMLFRDSSCSISRLEFFECKDGSNVEKNDKSLRKQQENKKVIRLSDCIRVTEVEMDGCPRDTGSFLVETTEKIYVFAADRNQLDDWTHKLCEMAFPMSWTDGAGKRGNLQKGSRVDENEGMEDNLLYSGRETDVPLFMQMNKVSLKLCETLLSKQLLQDESTFSFEAGRRCNSGEGSFEFDTKQGNALFQSVEAAINLQKISLPHRQISSGGHGVSDMAQNQQNHPAHSWAAQPQPHGVPQTPAAQAADVVYSMVTAPQNQQTFHNKDDCSNASQQQRPPMSRLEPPVDKILTGVKSLTLDTRGVPVPRKNQVKMISSCPLPNPSPESGSNLIPGPNSNPSPNPHLSPKLSSNSNPEKMYSHINMPSATGRSSRKEKRSSSNSAPCTTPLIKKEPDYSLPFDTIASNIMSNILSFHQADGDESGPDPLYDSIDDIRVRNIFRNDNDTKPKVDHIYDEPEGCAATGQEDMHLSVVYDDPEEMRGNAWRIMGTLSDPKGHEYPYNPRVDDYAVPKRPKRAFAAKQNTNEEEQEQKQEEEEPEEVVEEGEEEEGEEEEQDSPYKNVLKMI
ncbi:docking protein 2-like [Nematolebias whitei]|uniref:docking protein 2-like n=1 Tax=Nematolebias whitei TaxID=451745 RepID=UPI0018985FE7|nr:docking protein 2-like [Nematolebias whitei]